MPDPPQIHVIVTPDPRLLPAALHELLPSSGTVVATRSHQSPLDGVRHVSHGPDLAAMTPREREVLAHMAQGRSNTGIADEMFLSQSAVAKHINNIFTKLDIHPSGGDNRRVLAVLRYLQATHAGAQYPRSFAPSPDRR